MGSPLRNVLFVHNGVPGRFQFLAEYLLANGWQGALINGPDGRALRGMMVARWRNGASLGRSAEPFARPIERAMRAARGSALAARQLAEQGFVPDVIIGHPSWGEMLLLDDIFPGVPQIQLAEYYVDSADDLLTFDPEFADASVERRMALMASNATLALSLTKAAAIVSPTRFQANTFPSAFRRGIHVIHEGVDVGRAAPGRRAGLRIGDVVLAERTPIVTFVNRRFEPMRGFHVFMRALPLLLREHPSVHIVLAGMDDRATYGPSPDEGTWKAALLAETEESMDFSRVHFVGALAYDDLIALFRASWVHVYLTYPTVLSWSLLDAMACGCLVVGSDTAPVREVIDHEKNGLLTPFFDVRALVGRLLEVCEDPAQFDPLRAKARETIVRCFDRAQVCTPAWVNLIEDVLKAGRVGHT